LVAGAMARCQFSSLLYIRAEQPQCDLNACADFCLRKSRPGRLAYKRRSRRARSSFFCPASSLYAVTARIRPSRSVKTTANDRPSGT
jgi:hypothetical protein